MPSILIDTNLLIYLYDANAPEKSAKALATLDAIRLAGSGCLSVQNLAEFFQVSTRKLKPPLTPSMAIERIQWFGSVWPIIDLSWAIILEAARGVRDHRLAYYDAQIWATARLNQVPVIFSEDFQAKSLEGVRFVNPFAPDFDLSRWA